MTGDRRWTVGLVWALALVGSGLLFASPTLLAASLIPLVYVLYGTVSGLAGDPTIEATRSIAPGAPEPGEAVEVTLTVRNDSSITLPDVRVLDGVPAELAVETGSPRGAKPLSPGESMTISYTVIAKRGEYHFDEPTARVRSIAGGHVTTVSVPVVGEELLPCANSVQEPPLDHAMLPRAGTLPTDSGGSGLEFYSTRQYRPGDPMNRIDWRHYAKTGSFVTVQYRQEQAARTVIVVDARAVGRVTPEPGYPTGTALCAYAGERLYEALDRAGVVTSVTAVGLESTSLDGVVGGAGLPWIDRDAASTHGIRPPVLFREIQTVAETDARPVSVEPPRQIGSTYRDTSTAPLDESPSAVRADGRGPASQTYSNVGNLSERSSTSESTSATSSSSQQSGQSRGFDDSAGEQILPVDSEDAVVSDIDLLLEQLPPNAQVLVCSPLLDNWSVSLGRKLDAHGYSFVVVSPDVLQSGRPGQRIAGIHRSLRVRSLERIGEVVSWNPAQPINYAIHRSLPHLFTQS